MTQKKRKPGRPKHRPEVQRMHLRLAKDVYDGLWRLSATSGVPMNTLIERAIATALDTKKGTV